MRDSVPKAALLTFGGADAVLPCVRVIAGRGLFGLLLKFAAG